MLLLCALFLLDAALECLGFAELVQGSLCSFPLGHVGGVVLRCKYDLISLKVADLVHLTNHILGCLLHCVGGLNHVEVTFHQLSWDNLTVWGVDLSVNQNGVLVPWVLVVLLVVEVGVLQMHDLLLLHLCLHI